MAQHEDREAMLRALTHPRDDLTDAVINLDDLRKNLPLDNHITLPTPRASASLGTLDTLPLELIHEVLLALDLRTLTALRSVSTTARSLVSSNPAYRHITTHAPDSLRALLATTLASSTTTSQLHSTLCTPTCALCPDFGPFLFLPNCLRCCWACLTQHPDLLPISASHARILFGLPRSATSKLPTLHSIPGVYKMRRKSTTLLHPLPLVSKISARLAGSALHGSRDKMESHVARQRAKQAASYDRRIAIYHQELSARFEKWELERPSFEEVRASPIIKKPSVPPFSSDVDAKDDDVRRLLGVLPFPVLDRRTGRAQWGVACMACTCALPVERIQGGGGFWPVGVGSGLVQYDGRKRELARMWTEEGYWRHFEGCARAQELWEFRRKSPAL